MPVKKIQQAVPVQRANPAPFPAGARQRILDALKRMDEQIEKESKELKQKLEGDELKRAMESLERRRAKIKQDRERYEKLGAKEG